MSNQHQISATDLHKLYKRVNANLEALNESPAGRSALIVWSELRERFYKYLNPNLMCMEEYFEAMFKVKYTNTNTREMDDEKQLRVLINLMLNRCLSDSLSEGDFSENARILDAARTYAKSNVVEAKAHESVVEKKSFNRFIGSEVPVGKEVFDIELEELQKTITAGSFMSKNLRSGKLLIDDFYLIQDEHKGWNLLFKFENIKSKRGEYLYSRPFVASLRDTVLHDNAAKCSALAIRSSMYYYSMSAIDDYSKRDFIRTMSQCLSLSESAQIELERDRILEIRKTLPKFGMYG